jgi:MoxR-like ATPase
MYCTETSGQTQGNELDRVDALRRHLNLALRGKPDVVELALLCLLANGHLLLEDKPGLGKTTLAKALAAGLGGRFSRCQCTPDLLPGDITGFSLFNQKTHEFEFREGPVFSDILLADEINRATPRTQSALLEAMAERQVTVDSRQYVLSSRFFVIATQNPIDEHGTYPLPQAQLDRFAMKVSIGYPDPRDEVRMLLEATRPGISQTTDRIILSPDQLQRIQSMVMTIAVVESVGDYLVRLAREFRQHPSVLPGLSPRGLLTWQRIAQAQAWIRGRDFITPDDVQDVAEPVLNVRLGLEPMDARRVIQEVLDRVAVPEYQT